MDAEWAKPGGWRFELENRAAIMARSMETYYAWRRSLEEYDWTEAEEIDPREWFDIESQGNLGSCAGNAVASCAEYCYHLKYGPEIQLSRMWAYLTAQEASGITGDTGSTLDGCTMAVSKRGICLEESFPYPKSYNEGLSYYRANKSRLAEEAANYKLLGEVPINSWDDAVRFLKSRTGAIQTGLLWSSSCDVEWEQKSYSPGSGGHSTALVGYLPVSGWPSGIGLLHKNSWGTGWARGGYSLIHKAAFDVMLRTKYNIFVGRAEAESPTPIVTPDL